ncbi:hypothetical protein NPIL_114711 [Nephila pilipes]|uniref:Uncharacterized protein n=1 Tax=Nephila pilipes TaxID=299642 RepID=A0A8X6PKA6_NEPPI|nr:hypothetical protein NPIL_114711 [Nephila pilipes]
MTGLPAMSSSHPFLPTPDLFQSSFSLPWVFSLWMVFLPQHSSSVNAWDIGHFYHRSQVFVHHVYRQMGQVRPWRSGGGQSARRADQRLLPS